MARSVRSGIGSLVAVGGDLLADWCASKAVLAAAIGGGQIFEPKQKRLVYFPRALVVSGFLIFVLIPGFWEGGGTRTAGTRAPGAAAMATRPAAYHLEESGRRVHRDPAAGDSSPPVLLLSHFCPSPFLCFGDVRVGATRTRSLILQNPHEEPLQVELSLLRAADQGFSVVPSRCELKVGVRVCPRGVAPLVYSAIIEEKLS